MDNNAEKETLKIKVNKLEISNISIQLFKENDIIIEI